MTMGNYEHDEDTIICESLPEMDRPISIRTYSRGTNVDYLLLSYNNRMETQPHVPAIPDCQYTASGAPVTMVSSADFRLPGNELRMGDLCERVSSMEMIDRDVDDRSAGRRCTDTASATNCGSCQNEPCSCAGNRHIQVDEFLERHESGVTEVGDVSRRLDVEKTYSRDNDGDTILHIAIIIRALEIAMFIINMTPAIEFLNIANALFQTPLHLAVLTNQIALVRRLVVGGAKVESRDKDGNTSLHIACRDARVEIVKTLLEPVTYVETKQNLQYEIPYQRIPQNLEINNYDGVSCLHIAAARNHMDIVDILIVKGANVNAKECKRGYTILHEACWAGNLQLVKYLLRCKDCHINARTFDGYTPFDLARSRNNWEVCMQLASAGAKYRDDDSDGY